MRISHGTKVKGTIAGTNGYGYATLGMLESLNRLGYQVERNDASADVEIWFDQPHHWKWSPNVYRIGYHPWESTSLLPGWADMMNMCDEIWTPSPLIAHWYKQYAGITVPIYVYEHGIDHIWNPVERKVEDTIKFLHVGAEATRKGGWDTVRLFRKAFLGRDDVSLTIKMINSNWNNIPQLGKVHYINEKYNFDQLQNLFYDHHAYVYPSWGEGFGLTPLQSISSGMPAITTPAWAPYRKFLDSNLNVSSSLAKSSWPEIHPGYMLRPDFDDVIDKMRYLADNYEKSSEFALSQTENIHKAYDWDTITSKVFSDLENRLK